MTNYFFEHDTFIENNISLRKPQILAYKEVKQKLTEEPTTSKIVVLPTGTGKTGLMGLLPFNISEGRVLIITPSLIIREGISDEFDTRSPFNFWTEKNVILDEDNLPTVYRYAGYDKTGDKKRVVQYLTNSNIVIANIHKVFSQNSKKTLVHLLDEDFFDMIIIDEAHHSEANSWQKAMEHFSAKKIVKLTATPFRSDLAELQGDIVFNYPMADAINNKFIKNVNSQHYTNEKLTFEFEGEKLTLEEALKQTDSNWVSRSVAYSTECSKTIVEQSVNLLREKRTNGQIDHQIIAVACSVDHAKEIVSLYEETGLKCDYIVSTRPIKECNEIIVKYKKGQLDVLVNVNMLGEGFDNPTISIAAIFRPFRTLAPYAQFIGRSLRKIKCDPDTDLINNIAHVVYHKELGLEELWNYYSGQKKLSNKKKELKELIESTTGIERKKDVGLVSFEGALESVTNEFLLDGSSNQYHNLIQKTINDRKLEREKKRQAFEQQGFSEDEIKILMETLRKKDEESINAQRIERRAELIREELHEAHTELILEGIFSIEKETGIDLKGTKLPDNTSNPILKNATTNEAYMIIYINNALKRKLKRGIDEWETYDFRTAEQQVPILLDKLKQKIIMKQE